MSKKNKGGAHGAKKARNKKYVPYKSRYGSDAAAVGGMLALSERQHADKALAQLCHTMVTPFDTERLGALASAYWVSFARIKMHDASLEAWSTVSSTLNMTLLLCEKGYGEEHIPLVNTALEAMFKSQQRAKRTGTYRLDGAGMTAVPEALQVHDEQMTHTTPLEMIHANAELKRRMAAGNVFVAEKLH